MRRANNRLRLRMQPVSIVAASAVALVCAFCAVACGHVETHAFALRPIEPSTTKEPDLVFEGTAPPRPVYDVALVQAIGYGDQSSLADLTAALRSRGVALGCDAIVRVRIDRGAVRSNAYGVCVRYAPIGTAPSPTPSPKPLPSPTSPEPAPISPSPLSI